ncbi:hypothetical protein Ancab_012926, partial [Ancistrocladus abbreviatus]
LIGLSMLVESLLAQKRARFLLVWILKEEDQGGWICSTQKRVELESRVCSGSNALILQAMN